MTRRHLLLAGLGPALFAALTLAGHPVGLGAAAVALALVSLTARAARPRDPWRVACWAAAAALASMPALRAAGWVAALSLLAAVVVGSLGAAGARGWREVVAGAAAWLGNLVPGLFLLALAGARSAATPRWDRLAPVVRGTALSAALLAVFVPLFLTADAAFAQIVGDTFDLDVEVAHPADRVALFVLVAGLAGSLVITAVMPAAAGRAPSLPRLGRTEWLIALGALDALFAAFVALQLAGLFGGDAHVLRTAGLTYAEYARQGFAQLMAAAALTLGVIALARRDDRTLRALLALLCGLTLVVLASALKRLGLYEEAFGFTRLRLVAHAAILWLGGVFVLVLAAGAARKAGWLPRATVAFSALAMLGFGLANPDARIAERNADRFERGGQLDRAYLRSLSPDAVPQLTRLPAAVAGDVLDDSMLRLERPEGLAGANLGRARARAALRNR